MTKQKFIDHFERAIRSNANFVGVKIMNGADGSNVGPEYIINPRENFEAKYQYYLNAYDDDMCLKANKAIRIVDCTCTTSFGMIYTLLSDG